MVFDRVAELEVVMGGRGNHVPKHGALWDIKISRGILGLLKKTRGMGGQSRFFKPLNTTTTNN